MVVWVHLHVSSAGPYTIPHFESIVCICVYLRMYFFFSCMQVDVYVDGFA